MWRWTAIAMLLLAGCLMTSAQRHGGGMSGGRSGFVSRGSSGVARGPASFGGRSSPGVSPSFRTPFGFNNRFNRRFGYGYPRYYGYSTYYPYWSYYGDAGYPFDSYQNYNPPSYYVDQNYVDQGAQQNQAQQNQVQQDEIDRLESEVDRLREEREAAPANQQRNSQSRNQAQPATVLVFGDKHTQEVNNYAIVGQTLWIFSEQRATKVPLAQLDLPATTKANDDRGVDFRVPE